MDKGLYLDGFYGHFHIDWLSDAHVVGIIGRGCGDSDTWSEIYVRSGVRYRSSELAANALRSFR